VTILVVLLTLVVAVLATLVVGLLRSQGAILRHLHDLGIGLETELDPGAPSAPAQHEELQRRSAGQTGADIEGISPTGEDLALAVVGTAHDTVLVFLSTGCTTCLPFWEALGEPGRVQLPAGTRLLVVTQGPDAESPSEVARLAPAGLTTVMSSTAWHDHDVPGSPYVAMVEARTGRIRGSGTGASWEQVAQLLQLAEGESDTPAAPPGRRAASDRRREQELDAILLSAGIEPGDPSLYLPTDEGGDA
jgi:hypothetical protein